MKNYLLAVLVLLTFSIYGQSEDEAAILNVMKQQEEAWNNFDLEAFMEGYWKSDSLKFFGKKRGYPWLGTNPRPIQERLSG